MQSVLTLHATNVEKPTFAAIKHNSSGKAPGISAETYLYSPLSHKMYWRHRLRLDPVGV